jgi:hypothetical protein
LSNPALGFLLASIVFLVLGIYYYPRNRPRLAFDRVNKFLICITISIFVWIAVELALTHTLYIGDFNAIPIVQKAFAGEPLLGLPVETADVFPTLGDTVLIGYMLAFLFSLFAGWRAFENCASWQANTCSWKAKCAVRVKVGWIKNMIFLALWLKDLTCVCVR